MSGRVCVILFAVLVGLVSAADIPKGQCVDNTLYAKYICKSRNDGEKLPIPGKCSEYYECSNGESQKKSCGKFFDFEKKKCVSKSDCVEVDNTDCVIPTPPPCSGNVTPAPPTTCECPTPEPTTTAPDCPVVTCITPTCPTPSTCPPIVTCTTPPPCPTLA